MTPVIVRRCFMKHEETSEQTLFHTPRNLPSPLDLNPIHKSVDGIAGGSMTIRVVGLLSFHMFLLVLDFMFLSKYIIPLCLSGNNRDGQKQQPADASSNCLYDLIPQLVVSRSIEEPVDSRVRSFAVVRMSSTHCTRKKEQDTKES